MITDWGGITIGKYLSLLEVSHRTEPEDVEIGIVALLCDESEDKILGMAINDYQKLRKSAQFVASFPKIRAKCPKHIVLDGVKYNITRDVRKMSTAAYIDFQTYSKKDFKDSIVEVLSCFLIPDGKSYCDGYDVIDVHDDIRNHMPVVVAYEMAAFFLSRLQVLTMTTLFFSERMMRRMLRKEKDPKMREMMTERMKDLTEIRSRLSGVGLNPLNP